MTVDVTVETQPGRSLGDAAARISAGEQEQGVDGNADEAADDRAVDPHELEVPTQLQFETM
jgi:hypothetical protein